MACWPSVSEPEGCAIFNKKGSVNRDDFLFFIKKEM